MLDSFRPDTVDAIKKAAELGAQGLLMYAPPVEVAPENMSTKKDVRFWIL